MDGYYPPLVVIVGPTASGKSALAIEIAKKYDGEIICADSRTIYKGMDIGTAKPTKEEQQGITHHLIDIITPDQSFNVATFQTLTFQAITDISTRGKLPILVGGSGLYVDACIYNYTFRPIGNTSVNDRFKNASVEELQQALKKRNLPLPENKTNRRYLLRTLEAGQATIQNTSLRPNTLIIGIAIDQKVLKLRSHKRTKEMVQRGVIDELRTLSKVYGWDIPAMQSPAYKAFRDVVENQITVQQAIDLCVRYDLKLAKKQHTWFKRNKSIQWLNDPSKYVELMTTFLNK